MKHQFTTPMLFVSVAILGAFIWFFERDDESTHEKDIRTRMVFSVYPESINRIRLERGETIIECSKQSGAWRLTHPTEASVNVAIVEQMISGMASVERGELITADTLAARGLTTADYGFDAPRAQITFENNRGTSTWLIGNDAKLDENLYVMNEGGDTIIVASKNLLNLVPDDPTWIRDRTLFRDKATSIRGIDLRRKADDSHLKLRLTDDEGWMMQLPQTGRTDSLSIHAIIDRILEAKIAIFITDEKSDLALYGLDEPRFELTLFAQDEQTQTLLIGAEYPEQPELHYAKWVESDAVFTVPSEWANEFDLNSDLLRSRQILSEPLDQIQAIEIADGEQHIELVHTNNQWVITRPSRWEAEASEVENLLTRLSEGFIETFIDTPTPEHTETIENAQGIITFLTGDKHTTLHISHLQHDGFYLVKRDDETAIYRTAGDLLNPLFTDPLTYRSRTILEISPTEIEAITLETTENKSHIENVEGLFSTDLPEHQTDADALFELTKELSALRTKKYVAFNPESLIPYGLDAPQAQLTVTFNTTNMLGQVLLIGNTSDDGHFAMLQGQSIVFILPEQTATTLTRNLTIPIEKETEEIEQP